MNQAPKPGGRTNENPRWLGSSLMIDLFGCEQSALSWGLQTSIQLEEYETKTITV